MHAFYPPPQTTLLQYKIILPGLGTLTTFARDFSPKK